MSAKVAITVERSSQYNNFFCFEQSNPQSVTLNTKIKYALSK